MKYFLAIDVGASSGRHMLGHLENGRIVYQEVYRFSNEMITINEERCWDIDVLFKEVLNGLKECFRLGKHPESVGVDTWGVDFVLLDSQNKRLGNAVAYRDARTAGMDKEVYKHVSEEALYRRTGIQKQPFNTLYQLMALKKDARQYLSQAKRLLMLPDYLHYRLCGVAKTEYTIATTTGLVNADTKTWDDELIQVCGYPRDIFMDIALPGTTLGFLKPDIAEQVGFNCKVVLPASHDTASAVMAVPSTDEATLYISSGTWSLIGIERLTADCSEESRIHNFTNEGGYGYRYRYLKNITGLWMIQRVKKELQDGYSFAELCNRAEKETIASAIDSNHSRFLSPPNMIDEIQQACAESKQPVPQSPGEIAAVVYNSLAVSYRDTIRELEHLTRQRYGAVYIVGGGANVDYLNRLTATYTGKTVYANPTEATSIGNLMAQMIADGLISDLEDGRTLVRRSFEISQYQLPTGFLSRM